MYKKVTVMSDVRTLLPIKVSSVDPEQTRSGTDWGGELQYFMLIGQNEGDAITFAAPDGEKQFEIIEVRYI